MNHVTYEGDLVPAAPIACPPAAAPRSGELLPQESQPRTTNGGGIKEAFEFTIRTPALLFVLWLTFGPLSLPLIIVSPKLGVFSKVMITTATLFLTIVLPIALTIYFSHFAVLPALDAIRDANARGGAI
ncbi:hypothetical protein LOC68_18245 [Blastopirellula sp. JC732]|uniref:Uncharacterized protein n=1 Tax=Blastopirellula sediminis TaxID=2894196 RepID=A0A9X1SGM1_9BACT|nr:hypothetical protein [Blastopirellula sediminis]MCC9606362.1 hypothetical protein [Blastopirellula sediminis]MCC9630340.1 hypothetical protein [Blastopirellula sediminis]